MQIISNRIIPLQKNEGSIIDRLKIYISPVDSTWFERLKPASEEQLEELKQILNLNKYGLQLPAAFIEFMRYAGEGAGGLFLHTLFGVEMSLSSFKPKLYINEIDSKGPYCFDILRDHDIGFSYSMNLGEKNQKIIMEADWEVSDSFENLVFQCAVETYEYKYFDFFQGFGVSYNSFHISEIGENNADVFNYLHGIAEQYHLHEVWFNDTCFYFAYSNEIALKIRRSETGGFRGFICFNEVKMAKELDKVLSKIGAKMNEIEPVKK